MAEKKMLLGPEHYPYRFICGACIPSYPGEEEKSEASGEPVC